MFEQAARSLLYGQLLDHVSENVRNGEKTFRGGTDVLEASIVKEDFLEDKDGDGLGKLGRGLHDAQAEGNDIRAQQESDNLRRVDLNESTNDT